MKRKATVICASVACMAILAGVLSTGVYAACVQKPAVPEEAAKLLTRTLEQEAETAAPAAGNTARDETVYVFSGADGSTRKVVASDWLQDESGNQYANYQTEKDLPVEMHISYRLNGTEIAPEELEGKSGNLTIAYDFESKKTAEVTVNGTKKTVQVPFAAVTAVILENDVFSSVEVTGGKLVNDGDRCMVLGLAFPGLQENLGTENSKTDLPGHLEITAGVKDFKMLNTMTLVTNEVFRGTDTEKLGELDGLDGIGEKLTEAMDQLLGGASQLKNGLATLQGKVGELTGGVQSLCGGASQVNAGAAQLSAGLNQLSQNSAALNAGAAQVFHTLLAQVTEQINAQLALLHQQPIETLTPETYAAVLDQLIALLTQTVNAEAAAPLVQAKSSLDSYAAFYNGLTAYTAGVDQAQAGAARLASGAAALDGGAAALNGNMPALTDGVNQLYNGSMQLSAGLEQFNEEAVQKLKAMLGGDIKNTLDGLRASLDAADTYTGLSEDAAQDSSVKFIYRTEAIG